MTIPTLQSLGEQEKGGENKIRSTRTETTNRLCIIFCEPLGTDKVALHKKDVQDSKNFYGALLLTSGVGGLRERRKREAGNQRGVGGRGDG